MTVFESRSCPCKSRLTQAALKDPRKITNSKGVPLLPVTIKLSILVRLPLNLDWNGLKLLGVTEN